RPKVEKRYPHAARVSIGSRSESRWVCPSGTERVRSPQRAMAGNARRGGGLRRLVLWTVVIGVLASGLVGFVLYREITGSLPPVTTGISAADGPLIGELSVERPYLVPLDQVPAHVRNAFLAAEDADFYRHHGFNPISIVRALLNNIIRRERMQGGSTITQ